MAVNFLANEAALEDSGRRNRDIVLQVGHAVATLVDDISVLLQRKGATRGIRPVPRRKNRIDAAVPKLSVRNIPLRDRGAC